MFEITAEDVFLPTPSARRATFSLFCLIFLELISTHALREEGDNRTIKFKAFGIKFLPTPSARRATLLHVASTKKHRISTHALREEGDLTRWPSRWNCIISTHALREEGDLRFQALV